MNEISQYQSALFENAAKLSKHIQQWLAQPETYFQLLLGAIVITLACAVAALIRHKVSALRETKEEQDRFGKRWFISRSGRLLAPLLTILCLAISRHLSLEMGLGSQTIDLIENLAIIWLLWVAIRAYVKNPVVRYTTFLTLLPAVSLKLFGLFEPTVEHLNGYGFSLGEVEITAYTFLKGVFYFSIIIWFGKLLSQVGEGYIRRSDSLARPTQELLVKLFDIALFTILFLVALNLIGIDITALTVFSGALGVGLGFGLQKIASNFVSGIILLTEKSININNLIEMNDGVFGYVRKLGARASIVETFDGKEVMVPNEDFITSRVANHTHSNSKGRVEIAVGVSYGSDLRKVYDLILEAANEYEGGSKDESFEPQCFLREWGDSSVNFLLTFWLDDVTEGRWRAQSDVMFSIWDKFQEHDIEIPFPQRDLHIKSGLDALNKGAPAPKKAPAKKTEKKKDKA